MEILQPEYIEEETPERKKIKNYLRQARSIIAAGVMLGLSSCLGEKSSQKEELPLQKPIAENIEKDLEKSTSIEQPLSEVEETLKEFPKEIPGGTVTIENIEGAKKILIMIKQYHLNPAIGEDPEMNAADIYWDAHITNEVNKDIEKIVYFLKEKYQIDELYYENLPPDSLPIIEEEVKNDPEALHEIELEYHYKNIIERLPEFPFTLKDFAKKFPYSAITPIFLMEENKVKIKSAESEELMSQITPEALSLNNMKYVDAKGLQKHHVPLNLRPEYEIVFKKREEHVLKLVKESKKKITTVVFGGMHHWGDDVKNENIGLVVVTPNAKNESFITTLILNSGIDPHKDSWVEFHFRDFIEDFEKTNIFNEELFKRGEKKMKTYKHRNNLNDEEIEIILNAIRQASKDQIELIKSNPSK